MVFKILTLFGLLPALFYLFCLDFLKQKNPENSAPEVRITKPLDQSSFEWNSIITYSINVSDQEDGKSEYEEIDKNTVLLEVTYQSDAFPGLKKLNKKSDSHRNILRLMSNFSCLNCHASNAKLIGPSFDLIARRYIDDPVPIDTLIHKVLTGSTGIWGDVPMPPQPHLSIEKAKKIVTWILENGANPNYNFYTGTDGAFKTTAKEVGGDKNIYILTASYADRGLENLPNSSKEGEHTIVLVNND